MTSDQTPSQPTPPSDTRAFCPREQSPRPVEWIEQPNGDRVPVTAGAPAACERCGIVYHAEDLLFGLCPHCEDIPF